GVAGPVPALILLDVEDDGARLSLEAQPFFGPDYIVEILRAREAALQLVRIDGEAAQMLPVARERARLRLPLCEGAVQVVGNGAAHLGELHIFVVMLVHEVRREFLPAGALAGERDHGLRPISASSAARISV